MTTAEFFRAVGDGAEWASRGMTDSDARQALQLVSTVSHVVATLSEAGVADPTLHITRILSDDELVARTRVQRELALDTKFGKA